VVAAAQPNVALIVPTRDRPLDLNECLASIAREACPPLKEVIVVDDCPERPARTPPTIGGVPIRLVRNTRSVGAALSRNRGIEAVGDGVDVLGFLDDDARIEPGWLSAGLAALQASAGAVTGPVQRFDHGLVARARQLRYERRYEELEPGEPVDFLAGGNSLAWRGAVVEVGGFPDCSAIGDVLLARALRASGRPCQFAPSLVVSHRNSKGLGAAARQAWRAGRINGIFERTTYLTRLMRGVADVWHTTDPAAAALNVMLDAVFLMGDLTARTDPTKGAWWRRQR
jgi:glycosyltransferase involved in cell wall biosynthesis